MTTTIAEKLENAVGRALQGNRIMQPKVTLCDRMLRTVRSWMPANFSPLTSKERAIVAAAQTKWETVWRIEQSLDGKKLWMQEQAALAQSLAEGLEPSPGRLAHDLPAWQAHASSVAEACKQARRTISQSISPIIAKAHTAYASELHGRAVELGAEGRAQSDLLGIDYVTSDEILCIQAVEDFARRAARDADKPTNASPASRLQHVLTLNP